MAEGSKYQRDVVINGRAIGQDQPPYVIAELSANHNGRLETALEIIDQIATTGASAIKLQTYTADTITLDADTEDFCIEDGLWAGRTLHELYAEAHTPWDWHKPLFERAKSHGVTMFSSPFDTTAVDFLEDLNAPAYKIASFEAIDLPLIRYVAGTGKPMIISTGMADRDEIGEAIAAARDGGCQSLVVLHCVSGYPAPAEDYNLATVADLANQFDVLTGLSDHTIDNATAVAAVALGAVMIEKHVTLDRKGGGPDDSFSLEPAEFAELCKAANIAKLSIGRVDYGRKSSEQSNVKFRRSLYFVEDIPQGVTVKDHMIRSVRPGYGLSPKFLDRVVGKVTAHAITKNTPVTWEALGVGT